jgi:hypothetical protein
VAALREPFGQAIVVLAVLALIGVAALVAGWRGAARTPYVPLQMPWLLSGTFGGVALVGLAVGAWSIHLSRRADAEAQLDLEAFCRELADVCDDLRPADDVRR